MQRVADFTTDFTILLTLLLTVRLLATQAQSSSAVQESRGDGGRVALGACGSTQDAVGEAVCNRPVPSLRVPDT